MKKFLVLILATLLVYNSECWLIKDLIQSASNATGNVLGAIRHRTTTTALPPTPIVREDPHTSEHVPQLPKEEVPTSESLPVPPNEESSTKGQSIDKKEPKVVIKAKDNCPSGTRKVNNGNCEPYFRR